MKDQETMTQEFQGLFNQAPEDYFFSPGRINLIGEHTDYNGGKVFPAAITMGTYALVSRRDDHCVQAYSANFPDEAVIKFQLDDLAYRSQDNWANYVKAMLLFLQEKFGNFSFGFNLYIYGTIPNGASLSSSASLEVLTGVIARHLYQLDVSGTELALLGMRTENEYLSLNSGIMDQFIIANGQEDHALLLDTHTLDYEAIPLDLPHHQIVIMNSLTRRELVDSEYNKRREECEEALKRLQSELSIDSLGELDEETFEERRGLINDDILEKRAKHAVYENKRTEKAAVALKNNHLADFGELMNESHISLHEDYEVTVEETDLLVRLAWETDGVIGARMTGGGFGGCCIAIVENQCVDQFIDYVGKNYEEKIGHPAEFYLAQIADGAKLLAEEK